MSLLPAPVYTVYPTGDDVLAAFQSTGIVKNPPSGASALINWNAKALAAIAEWEELTGYSPFLSDGTQTTWTYPASKIRRGILPFDNGLVSATSLSVGETVQVAATDYVLEPQNAGLSGKPYKRARFLGNVESTSVINVVGVHGYGPTLPADAWQAILNRAMVGCAPELSLKISGGRTAIRAGKVSLEFVRASGNRVSSGGPLAGESQQWTDYWSGKILQYRR